MTIDELIAEEFFQPATQIYLNHAAVAPWPLRTRMAVEAFAQENYQVGARNYPAWIKVEQETRHLLAQLINAPDASDIALLKNTSEGLSFIAYGLNWQAGDNVVISSQEFPSNRVVWHTLRQFGVEVREVDLHDAATPEDALLGATDKHTRLLSISSVQYASGLRMQLERLGDYCQTHDILFCVDAIQSIGAMRFDVRAIAADFVVADGHKWMLGPEGVALFYCRRELQSRLKLHEYGWHMLADMTDYTAERWEFAESARRFECGSPNMLGIHALHASLSLLLEAGMAQIETRLLERTRILFELINSSPALSLLTDTRPTRHAGIVTFRHHGIAAAQLHERLMQSGVVCAARGGGIRFSPHFYTDTNQLAQAIKLASLSD